MVQGRHLCSRACLYQRPRIQESVKERNTSTDIEHHRSCDELLFTIKNFNIRIQASVGLVYQV